MFMMWCDRDCEMYIFSRLLAQLSFSKRGADKCSGRRVLVKRDQLRGQGPGLVNVLSLPSTDAHVHDHGHLWSLYI